MLTNKLNITYILIYFQCKINMFLTFPGHLNVNYNKMKIYLIYILIIL